VLAIVQLVISHEAGKHVFLSFSEMEQIPAGDFTVVDMSTSSSMDQTEVVSLGRWKTHAIIWLNINFQFHEIALPKHGLRQCQLLHHTDLPIPHHRAIAKATGTF
jgi:hypothetical protein